MNEKQMGWFSLILGSALLLYTIIPGQYVASLVVIGGAIVMILYGIQILGLHSVFVRLFQRLAKD